MNVKLFSESMIKKRSHIVSFEQDEIIAKRATPPM